MRPFRLSRRAVLRGAGSVAIALPWLEAMAPEGRSRAATPSPTRFLAVFQPGGTILDQWRPTGTETDFSLSPILAPLEPVKDRLIVLDGIDMTSAVGEQNQSGMVALLTGTLQKTAGNYASGPSIDQVLASQLGTGTPLRSLELAVRWGTGKARGLASPIDILNFEDTQSFSPIPPRIDPVAIWNELFGTLPPTDPDAAWDRSILDAVARRYSGLSQRLGAVDRARLEQHLDRIRELEQRLSAASTCSAPELVDTAGYDPLAGMNAASDDGNVKDPVTDAAIPLVGKLMIDMMVMAMSCDMTAVGTLQWSDCEAKHTLPWLGLLEPHSYYQNDGGFHPTECAQIATWYSEQHAYLIQRMAAVDRGGHSLLDESVLFFGTNIQDPSTHKKDDMPFLLAGGGGLRTGRYVKFDHPSHNDLLVSILNLFGDGRITFGDPEYCTGALAGI